MTPLPNLDPLTPEGRYWHRLTVKPREWVFELGMTRAMNLPDSPRDVKLKIPGHLSIGEDQCDAFADWAESVFREQTQSQDGKEYMAFFVDTLKPILPMFFANPSADILNYKSLPLMTRALPAFRGLIPVHGTITVTKIPGAPADRDHDINVHPIDALGAIMEA